MPKNKIQFISDTLEHNIPLAAWFYLLGVQPEQFESIFNRPEYRTINEQVPAYHRYAAHLRKILISLADDNVHAFIKIPKEPYDNILYGYLYHLVDQTYLHISYNGVDGICVSDGTHQLLGGIPPVNIHPELCGNYRFIDKKQRDILFQCANHKSTWKNITDNNYERITDDALTEERLTFLVSIAKQYMEMA